MLLSFRKCITSPLRYAPNQALLRPGFQNYSQSNDKSKCSLWYNFLYYINKYDTVCRCYENLLSRFAVYCQMRLNPILERGNVSACASEQNLTGSFTRDLRYLQMSLLHSAQLPNHPIRLVNAQLILPSDPPLLSRALSPALG